MKVWAEIKGKERITYLLKHILHCIKLSHFLNKILAHYAHSNHLPHLGIKACNVTSPIQLCVLFLMFWCYYS